MMTEHPIPHLKTADTGAQTELETKIIASQVVIETWFRENFQKLPTLLTSSVDIRNAGFKLSPVDTNLFPAGFNNLNPDSYPLAIQALQFTINKIHQKCQRILIIPEAHTRNQYYLQSLWVLNELFTKAGFDVKIGTLSEIAEPKEIKMDDGKTLLLHPLITENNLISVKGFMPCIILLNNDLSEGVPDIFENHKQFITPNPMLGWSNRLKTQHFTFYNSVAATFAKLIDIDPWLITPYFEDCGEVDFVDGNGGECLQSKVSILLEKIKQKYKEYNIVEEPYVVVKANAGTYGMAVMMVKSPDELVNLNRKQKQKMAKSKGGKVVDHVILQEGVHTFETIGPSKKIAEPVVYMIGNAVVGGFYRLHQSKGPDENLNSPGMTFEPLAFDDCCNHPDSRLSGHASKNKFYVYSVIARLALMATCYEAQQAINQLKNQ